MNTVRNFNCFDSTIVHPPLVQRVRVFLGWAPEGPLLPSSECAYFSLLWKCLSVTQIVILDKPISKALGLQPQSHYPQTEKTGNSLFLMSPQDFWSNILASTILEGVCPFISGVNITDCSILLSMNECQAISSWPQAQSYFDYSTGQLKKKNASTSTSEWLKEKKLRFWDWAAAAASNWRFMLCKEEWAKKSSTATRKTLFTGYLC